ncbi:MAG: M4 family metallopeptidase [Taibaiella sp.]|jgi:Zn-dependent metalloprotease
MKRAIFKSILLAAGVITCQNVIYAQQQTRSSYAGITVPVKNGTVMTNLRGKAVPQKEVSQNLAAVLGLSTNHTFRQVSETKDKSGITHTGYQQYYLNVKVEDAKVLVHAKDGLVNSINGKVAQLGTLSVYPVLKENEAYTAAKNATRAAKLFKTNYPVELVIAAASSGTTNKQYALAYKVRIDGRTNDRKVIMVNVFIDAVTGKVLNTISLMAHTDVTGAANTLYSGTRSLTVDSVAEGFRLWDNARNIRTFNGAGAETDNQGAIVSGDDYFNSTSTFDLFNTFSSSTISTASSTLLSGLSGQSNAMLYAIAEGPITTGIDSIDFASDPAFVNVGGQSSLPETTGGMYNILDPNVSYTGLYMNIYFQSFQDFELIDTAYYPISDLTTGSHPWSDTKGNSGSYVISLEKNPAVDAHWGMQKTHDFYSSVLNRNSYDNQGSVVKNYVNAGDQYNASAMPDPYNYMQYGMGDGQYMNPVVGLDVMGHEFTHMVTEHNGNGGLNYQGESGALNESFSDIFGTSIEFFAKGQDANWNMGEGIMLASPGFFRSMAQPKLAENPDTYEGQYWKNPANLQDDNGGVHYNSGVQNKWFYLLTQGGSGTNDNGDVYTVTGLGIAKAEQIAYHNLMNYLVPGSEYIDAYEGSLQSALDLYGNDSTRQEYKSIKEAWYAVGIGEKPTTAVNEIAVNNDDLKLYPNPATGRVTISSNLTQTLDAQIINVVGIPVMNITVSKGLNPVDISTLAKGVYMIRYNTGAKGYVQKLSVL